MKRCAVKQSAQRSKARKLRHIMQLEDEVQSLQAATQQQQGRIGALQQENALLSKSSPIYKLLQARHAPATNCMSQIV